jgi:phenylpyruvate tautomerase PptA (4-oxalocrotonate tautomerase family)
MPLYRCTSSQGVLNDTQRAALAHAFTDIHCDLTGAPRTFVHVQFLHRPAQHGAMHFELHAGIRAGRDRALADAIIARCKQAVADQTGTPLEAIIMRTSSTPP